MSKIKVWFEELRPPFLILSIVFTILGIVVALKDGYFNPLYAVLTLVGIAALHAAANVLNDYFDYRSGIDIETERTPFSGGSGILPSGKMTPNAVLVEGILLLLVGLVIGLYFIYVSAFNPILITLVVFAGVGIVLYSPIISHVGFGEVLVGWFMLWSASSTRRLLRPNIRFIARSWVSRFSNWHIDSSSALRQRVSRYESRYEVWEVSCCG